LPLTTCCWYAATGSVMILPITLSGLPDGIVGIWLL
jgi:hypothetical protein